MSEQMSPTLARILADFLLVVHATIVLGIVGGELAILIGGTLGWNWVRSVRWRALHLAAIGLVTVQTWLGWLCPFTVWEDQLRQLAGDPGYPSGLIAYWVHRLVYVDAPPVAFRVAYTLFGLLVVASWWIVPPRIRRNRRDVH